MTTLIVALTAGLLLLTGVVGVRQMMLAIMLVRPSCDRLFDWLKLTFDDQSGPGASINAIVIALAVVAIINVPHIALSASVLAWTGFLATAAASLSRTPDLGTGLRDLLFLCSYAAIFILPYAVIRSRETVRQCLMVALASSLVPSGFALLEIATEPAILTGEQRLQSTFTHPNIFAFYLVGTISLILYLSCSSKITLSSFVRRTIGVYATFLLLLLLLTQTRSAWVSMLIIVVGYSVVVDRRWLVLTLSLPLALLIPGVGERLSDLESGTIAVGYEQLNSLAWRELLWKNTLEWLQDSPPGLLGHGLGSYESYVIQFFPRGGNAVGPHNAFLQLYFENGIAGLASFIILMSTIALKLIAECRRDLAGSLTMLMMCAGYAVVFYYDNLLDYLQFQWFFWFLLGTVCASGELADHPSRRQLAGSRAPATSDTSSPAGVVSGGTVRRT